MSRIALLSVSILIVTGCASVQVQRDKAEKVKTIAIIGFSGTTQLEDKNAPKSGVGNMINTINATTDLANGNLEARRIEEAENAYRLLEKQLQTQVGWQVADRKLVLNDPTYKALMIENPNMGSLAVAGVQRLPDVLRAEVAERMDAKSRADLCQRLNVDAVAIAKVKYVIGDKGGFALGGLGKTTVYPKAIVSFEVLDGSPLPVWRDRFAEGKPTTEGLENVMGAKNTDNEPQVLTAAADSAIGKLIERYKQP